MVDHAANLIAWNSAAEEWYDQWGELRATERNFLVWLLTSPKAKETFVDWETVAHDTVARWRGDLAKFPMDKLVRDRIYELHEKSKELCVNIEEVHASCFIRVPACFHCVSFR